MQGETVAIEVVEKKLRLPRSEDTVSHHPVSDMIAARLYREGWSVGDVAVKYPTGCVWYVSGRRDRR